MLRIISVKTSVGCLSVLGCLVSTAWGQDPTAQAKSDAEQWWNWHVQGTATFQGDAGFPANYSGPQSLSDKAQGRETFAADLFGGMRLSANTEAHLDFLVWQGYGLSDTIGIENFSSGDAYKFGTLYPNYNVARLFVRHTVGLGGPKEDVADDQLTLAGKQDVSRLTFTVGRFAATDVFDKNSYAGDPETQFMSWGAIANLAWDYGADSIGFSTGAAVELNRPGWALRYGFFQLPGLQNSFTAEDQLLMYPARGADGPFFKSWSMPLEAERRYQVRSHPGTVRLMAWLNEADMAKFSAATAILSAQGPNADWEAARSYRYRYGFGLNWEQELSSDVGLFSRLGWNDGLEEAWAYSDANWTASLGTSVKGARWRRPDDTLGAVIVVSGASSAQQAFLKAGGVGILNGDGALDYGPESSIEAYYNIHLSKRLQLAFDYQFVDNPAFNQDRGPVNIGGVRLHFEF